MQLGRSYLFAPGNRPRLLDKVATVGADAVILDLEDSVPWAEKKAARDLVRQAVARISQAGGPPVFVRVNARGLEGAGEGSTMKDDLQAVACPELTGVMLPKAETPEEMLLLESLLLEREVALGLERGRFQIVAIIESARGVLGAQGICNAVSERGLRLALGAADLTLDLGIAWTQDETEIFYAAAHLVLASRAAGIEAPIDAVWPHIGDAEGLLRSARLSRQLGFRGKLCIHPSQVGPVNEAYSPTAAEIAEAKRIVEAFQEAERNGLAAIMLDGRMVDYPIARRAGQVLAVAGQ